MLGFGSLRTQRLGSQGTQAYWVRVWCWVRVWVRTEPSMPGFGGTQHAWVRFLANPGEPKRAGFAPGFTPKRFCLGSHRTQHAWVRFLANPAPGFARNPSVLGSCLVLGLRLGSHRTQHAWVWWNPARLGSVPCEPNAWVRKEPKRTGFGANPGKRAGFGSLQTQHLDSQGTQAGWVLRFTGFSICQV
ncbi:hypothetical protein SLEP1_g60544 [Rubroshorea leprosula]|uniref:Uncharacterized protein n=1 Tax=Rubroshorea leprosula TaxID=152421 RepID=A0AAV5MY89_9ROSI|nr:hypothetical protein SLEP1_g60544 [Rubroshorea leprosula]